MIAAHDVRAAYRELRRDHRDVPATYVLAWARTRCEVLAYVGADRDERGEYAYTVDLPDRAATVYVTADDDPDDCAWGDGCEAHAHLVLTARIPDRCGRTVLASLGSVCDDGSGTAAYEYTASCALDLAREAHDRADVYERGLS